MESMLRPQRLFQNLQSAISFFVGILLLLPSLWFSGCVSDQSRSAALAKAAPEKNRGIVVTQQLHQTAVSGNIGRWAVVVGISDYKYDTDWDHRFGFPDLQYADRDARAFAEFLQSPQGGAFAPDHVLLLTDGQATFKMMRKAIGDFLARSLERDIVIIYFAGHGSPDPKNPRNMYLLCHDTEPDNFWGTAFPMWDINTAIERSIRSRRIIVLADACHSAGVGGTRGNVSERFNSYMNQLATSREGVTKVTASRANELSQEKMFPGGGHGLFTYYLLEALKGRGDYNQDGFVTMNEAYDYLSDKVRSDSRHSQNPWASPFVSTDIPLGIVDKATLYDIEKRRQAAQKIKVIRPEDTGPLYAEADLPKDSEIAIKLALAKLVKNEPGRALSMVNAVIERQDSHKPDALAAKIQILLSRGDLAAAENIEDLLVIPYPSHTATAKGVRAVFDHYLSTMPSAGDREKIQHLATYIQRHPNGPLVKEAKERQAMISAGIRSRYESTFQEQILLARGFAAQNRFDRADQAIKKAAAIAAECRAQYGIRIDTVVLATLKNSIKSGRQSLDDLNFWQQAKDNMDAVSDEEQIRILDRFVIDHPYNAYAEEAAGLSQKLKQGLKSSLQKKLDTHLEQAASTLAQKDFPAVSTHLDAASDLVIKARELGFFLDQKELEALRFRYMGQAKQHRDHLVWAKARYAAGAIGLDTLQGFDDRMKIFRDFVSKWPDNSYVNDANTRIGELTSQKQTFRIQRFDHYYFRGQDAFINKDYTAACDFLEQARAFADPSQAAEISALADRYKVAGVIWKEPVTGMEFVWVPGGEFMMGSNDGDSDEKPVHKVRLDGFWMGKYEVTQGQWEQIMGNNPSSFKKGNDFPVECVFWNDARDFIEKLKSRTGYTFFLPSEAQWEYAARSGGKNRKYSGGDDVDRFAWYDSNSGFSTHKVGTKAPNDLGIYDMSGNVWEWCEDIYAGDAYNKHSLNGPVYEQGGALRVSRGGSWCSSPANVRCTNRDWFTMDRRDYNLGFRLLRTN